MSALVSVAVLLTTTGDGPDPGRRGPPGAVDEADGASDLLARTATAGLEQFWAARFPVRFGRPWRALAGTRPVDPGDPGAPPVCGRAAAGLAGQALYCPRSDLVAWDRAGLIPRLRRRYGPGAVLVALAHEYGHAVVERLRIDAAARSRNPPALVEGMADCFAGVAVRAASAGDLPGTPLGTGQADGAARALVELRDPVGGWPGPTSHGTAFDRVSAFLDGWDGDADACAAMPARAGPVTGGVFASLGEAASGGDLPLPTLVSMLTPVARTWFAGLRPAVATGGVAPTSGVPVPAAPVGAPEPERDPELVRVHERFGDYAAAELIIIRYALATAPSHVESDGPDRSSAGTGPAGTAICLSGAFTRALLDHPRGRDLRLSPGDVDEAVALLLDRDVVGDRPADRFGDPNPGLSRVDRFRAGMRAGPEACGVPRGRH